ncbi:hypothetical protein CR513_42444, partial [Mucuna pruriens]
MFQKLGLPISNLEECSGTMFRFVGEQVEIKGTIEIETVFKTGTSACSIPVSYTVVNVWASYNIIVRRPALNKLKVVVCTPHLCMKYPMGREADKKIVRKCYEHSLKVGPKPVDGNKDFLEDLGSHPAKELKEVQISPSKLHRMKIGMALDMESKGCLICFLTKNRDVFAWSSTDMLRIDPNVLCHRLSIALGTRPIT